MSSRNALNPYGGLTPQVDRLIGDAFPIVKNVYDNMDSVVAVGKSLTASVVGEPMLMQRSVVSNGATGALGSTVTIDFSDLDVDPKNILASNPRIEASNGEYYYGDSGVFTSRVTSLGLVLTLNADAPSVCADSLVNWHIIYQVPEVT